MDGCYAQGWFVPGEPRRNYRRRDGFELGGATSEADAGSAGEAVGRDGSAPLSGGLKSLDGWVREEVGNAGGAVGEHAACAGVGEVIGEVAVLPVDESELLGGRDRKGTPKDGVHHRK